MPYFSGLVGSKNPEIALCRDEKGNLFGRLRGVLTEGFLGDVAGYIDQKQTWLRITLTEERVVKGGVKRVELACLKVTKELVGLG